MCSTIEYPFIFRATKSYIETGIEPEPPTIEERIKYCLEHLTYEIEYKGYPRAIREFRKHYSGYLKGLPGSHQVRQRLVTIDTYEEIEEILSEYREYLKEDQ